MKAPQFNSLIRSTIGALLAFGYAAILAPAWAEDIDIYQGTTSGGAPNVMFFLDNTSNWSANNQAWNAGSSYDPSCKSKTGAELTACKAIIEEIYYTGPDANKKRPWEAGFQNVSLKQGQVELRALKLVLNRLVCSGTSSALKVNVGLALMSKQTVRSNGDTAGIINFAIQALTGTGSTAGSTCKAIIDRLDLIDSNITDPNWKAPSDADYSSTLYEIFKYFGGYANPAGAQATPTTAGSPIGAQGYGPVRFSKPSSLLDDPAAFTDTSKTTYKGPITSDGACGRNFIVLVGNTYPNAEPNGGPARFQGLNYTPPTLNVNTSDTSRYADEWTYFLANTDVSSVDGVQRVFTYTMNVYKDQPNASQGKLLKSMAAVGGVGPAGYVEVGGDLTRLVQAFSDILTSIAAVDSVFTAATLPVSTTTQGTYLNQVFIGTFRPEASGKPRWVGNLKQYKLAIDSTSGNVLLVDSVGTPAILQGTGFFSPLARSFWTQDSVFFAQMPSGTPLSESDSPDGQIVEKGGAAQMLRVNYQTSGTSSRNIYTLNSGGSLGPFSSANSVVSAVFDAASISFIRGENTGLTETSGSYQDGSGNVVSFGETGPRTSIHGDVLHSRPVALNYGNGDVVVFYGANDGFLRAVGGQQSGSTAGKELWSFVATEHFDPLLKRLRSNAPEVFLPSTDQYGTQLTSTTSAARKDYGMDGPIGVFARYSSGTVAEAIIYAAMRRGGRAVYAFDVSNKNTPTLKWKISNTTSGFSNLGQTWSMPRPVNFPPAYSADPIVVMGGGFDPAEDSNSVSNPQIGNAVFVINGRTGAKLAELATDYSVVGDVTIVDSNNDGVFDRGYVGDIRGNLYRINMTSGASLLAPDQWTIKKIAALGSRIYTTPDVVATKDFVAVLVGTGDREKPLLISTNDHFFMIKDTVLGATDRSGALTISNLTKFADVDESSGNLANINTTVNDPEGCLIELGTNGEKVVNSPYSVAGVTYFGTNRPTPPAANSCKANLGEARAYRFPLFCQGTPEAVVLDSGGMPPSPVGGIVTVNVNGSEVAVPFVIGAGTGGSPFEAERPRPPISPVRTRSFWKINNSNR